ncbi:cold-shock DNA-binding protein family [Rubellimicrobium thermophilum DSM 16684]|uniref:Cold-shock DNA-binding protein family n=1 Tax=Rubellimicrobium thermophilum DSM 16684 TaxID=1123069 RepID=S9QSF4_9RHOB|nr:cold shock protein [Rubellimicrobium thermophilum]EPX82542.1 cold-shock DNA-binding protein family [Rubellimicrobium thermophilum DSM 16684]
MTDSDDARPVVKGHVKWFDPAKGFGFVVADSGGPDILLHVNVLRSFGQGTVADGSGIEIEVARTERGYQAVAVLSIIPPAAPPGAGLADLAEMDPALLAAQPLLPARVKWFDKGKGFGFANVWGGEADVFLHIEVLRRSGFADLAPGEAVGLRVIEGRRGKLAVEVSAWDAVLREAKR